VSEGCKASLPIKAMMSEPRYTSAPVPCGHCQNTGIMTLAAFYSQVRQAEHPQSGEPFGSGDIYNLLECPNCCGITLRKYFWHDHMDSEADVAYQIIFPVRRDYNARTEHFYPINSQHDAYVTIREILQRAERSIQIIDPYVDSTIFDLLSTAHGDLQVQILTGDHKCSVPPDFVLEAKKFGSQYPSISVTIKRTRDFHDRFIIIDEQKCFHLGASIKGAGNKDFMIHALLDAENTQVLLLRQRQTWDKASPLAS
jgi:hypothetical protein